MSSSLPDGIGFREMTPSDVADVLKIIQRHNPDDAECATESYAQGVDGQFVLTHADAVAGVTGARAISDTDRSYWLSWTYLDLPTQGRLSCGDRCDSILFELVLEQLQQWNARKVFAMISPRFDSPMGGVHHFGGAQRSYLDFGFEPELTHRDYYDRGEEMTLLSYRVQPRQPVEPVGEDTRSLDVIDTDEIAETDDAYYLDWGFSDEGDEIKGLSDRLNDIREWRGRVVFIGIPHFATVAIEQLQSVGFLEEGRIADFYEDGIDEIRLRLDL
jgi:hypothetical protein